MTSAPTRSAAPDVSSHLAERARRSPGATAIIEPAGSGWRATSFAELEAHCEAIARGLCGIGLGPGERAALLIPPGSEFVATVFALFRLGAVPVLADPGMGASALARCIGRSKARALIGTPAAHLFRALHARETSSITLSITAGRRRLPGLPSLETLAARSKGPLPPSSRDPGAEAAVLFTSGSTGPAKGVVYAHANFEAQIASLRALHGFEEGEVDLACFPLFALFAPAFGMACAFPRLDASRPGKCDPAEIVRAARETSATTTFGSPAIWRRVVPWAAARGERLPALRRALVAGAPVAPDLVDGLRAVLAAGGEVHTPYGQTEALPLASISGTEILERRSRIEGGHGICVGKAVPGIELAIVLVTDDPLPRWSRDLVLPPGAPSEIGEICASGPVVTRSYADDPLATAAAKIDDGGRLWHRTGDLGYFDGDGRLWFCGRKSHRLETGDGLVPPVPTENVLNRHPRVARTALVGLGRRGSEQAAIVVEPVAGAMPRGRGSRSEFASELKELLRSRRADSPPRAPASVGPVLFKRTFPVDARHNAKIRSEELKRWAEKKLS